MGHFYGSKIKVCSACKNFFLRWAPNPQSDNKIQMEKMDRCRKVGMKLSLVNKRKKKTSNPKSQKFVPGWMEDATETELLSMTHQNNNGKNI